MEQTLSARLEILESSGPGRPDVRTLRTTIWVSGRLEIPISSAVQTRTSWMTFMQRHLSSAEGSGVDAISSADRGKMVLNKIASGRVMVGLQGSGDVP